MEPAKPNTLESSRIRSRRAEYARVDSNTFASSRVSRTRGVACSAYFEQPLRACLVLRTVQCLFYCFFIAYGHFNPYPWVIRKAAAIIIIIIIIMVIFKCYFSGEHIALSIKKHNNGVNIELGKTNRLKALCMMQINA